MKYKAESTDTYYIKKIYAPSSSLLQGKHLPFTPSPLRELSNSSEGGLVFIFKCGSRKEKYLGSVTI
jgi:hypothetical protein